MYFALTQEQTALRDAIGALLSRECPPEAVHTAWADGGVSAKEIWAKLTALDLPGALVPESAGGVGLDLRDIVPAVEEAGRVALPLPLVEVVLVAAPLLVALEPAGERLARVVDGTTLVGCDLSGLALVPHAGVASAFLLEQDGWIVWADADSSDVERCSSLDEARDVGRVVPRQVVRLSDDPEVLTDARDRGALGTAAFLIGLSRRLIAMTCEYVKQRQQFGVPIGSFQAVKHHLANCLLAVELAAPAVSRAAHSLATLDPSRRRDVAMAKALASEAAERVARLSLQCHGAMGYTVEYDLHLYAKRIWAMSRSWGDAEWHRSRIAHELLSRTPESEAREL